MAKKVFKQAFAIDYKGIDGESSSLEPDLDTGYNRAINLERAVGNSLRGRVGSQYIGYGFFGLFPYSYTRTQDQYDITYAATTLTTTKTAADGATIGKFIGINQQVWLLEIFSYTLTRVSGTYPFTWYTTVSGSNINFVIKANAVSILNTSLGDGITSSTNVWSLLNTIDGLAELSISRTTRGTCPPFAIVDGNQTTAAGATVTYGTRYTVTVLNTPHNFKAGDIVTFNLSTGLVGGFVISVTNTTIVYVGPQVTLLDGAILGYMGQSAATFPIGPAISAGSGNLTLSMPYWRLIPEGDASNTTPDYGGIFKSAQTVWTNKSSNSFFASPNAINIDGCLKIAASSESTLGIIQSTIPGITTSNYQNNLIKIDGNTAVRDGLFTAVMPVISGGVGILTGTYKYACFIKRYDAQGNIVEGPLSSISTITFAANYAATGCLFQENSLVSTSVKYGYSGFFERSCYKYLNESPAAGVAFTVDDNSAAPGLNAFIQPGDVIILSDNTAQKVGLWKAAFGVDPVGTVHRTRCTFYDGTTAPSSIKVADSSGYQINNNSEISTGLTVQFLRTSAGGNTFYELCEMPISGYVDQIHFYDNVTDAVLTGGVQFTSPAIGKEHNPAPQCSLVTQHQGGVVVARGPLTPNSIAFSSADGSEYFPTASNSLDLPSSYSGPISAIGSDTTDRLAVFKDRAYYDVAGDLDSGNISVTIKNEGDYGVSSHASLVRVKGSLIGVCQNGYVIVSNGNLDSLTLSKLNSRLINQSYNFNWATAANDSPNRCYICSIPTSGEPVTHVIDYSRDETKTFERTYPTKIDPVGGGAVISNILCYLSGTSPYGVFVRLNRFNGNSPGSGDGDSFIDNTNAINYVLESNPINFGEPAQLKTPIRCRLWSLPNDYVKEGWVTFSTLIETAASALATYIGGTTPLATSSSVTFSTANDAFKDVKLKNCKTHFYLIRFTTNTIRTAPFWTGYEIMFAESYDKEDLLK